MFVLIFFLALLASIGLVVDGGAKLRAAREASAIAEEAARAGAGTIEADRAYTTGQFVIDQQAAVRAARSYLTASGHQGTVSPIGTRRIRVTVHIIKPALLLSLVGIPSISVTRTATADLVTGIEGESRSRGSS